MNQNSIWIALAYLAGLSLLLALIEVNYQRWRIKGEYSRKVAHLLATLATIPIPYFPISHWHVMALALIFLVIMHYSIRSKQLNSIHEITRPSIGVYLLPVAIYLTYLGYTFSGDPVMYVLPMAILAVCDPAAAIAGMSIKKYNRRLTLPGYSSQKTLAGSLTFFIISMLISIGLLSWFQESGYREIITISLFIAFAGTLAELFSWRGSDNLSIPLVVQLVLWYVI